MHSLGLVSTRAGIGAMVAGYVLLPPSIVRDEKQATSERIK